MAASTAPAARAKVIELLQARAGLARVQVTWAVPTQAEDIAGEMMYLGGRTERNSELLAFGGKINESYTFEVIVFFQQDGDDPQTCETRGWDLVDEVEQAVRADLSLGALLNMNAEFGESSVSIEAVKGAWQCVASVPITCHAQI